MNFQKVLELDMKTKITPGCIQWDKQSPGGNRREWEVDQAGKLWPCCVWIQGWNHSMKLQQDDKLAELLKDNPNFNDLTKYTWEEVVKHPIYKSYINSQGWNSDNPPPMCVKTCGLGGDGHPEQFSKNIT